MPREGWYVREMLQTRSLCKSLSLSTQKKVGAIAADDPEEQDEIDSDDDCFFLEGIENWKHSPENESLEWRGQSEWRDD